MDVVFNTNIDDDINTIKIDIKFVIKSDPNILESVQIEIE